MRRLVWFSCGSPSAVAAKLTVQEFPAAEVLYCDTGGEHPDNRRFLTDVERWLGKEVTVLKNPKYADHFDVARKERYINGPHGAKCTGVLKRELREALQRPDDVHVWGFTAEEQRRSEDFVDHFPELACAFPLIEAGITREDCHGIIHRAGIRRPAMYRLGYHQNNCIGCWKGGMGYWNKIRRDFPEVFAEAAAICRDIGRSPVKDSGGKPILLDDLPPDAGRYETEPEVQCGIGCFLVDEQIRAIDRGNL
jgi:Phosphoadenosine phosphosulfate reductase family